MTIKIRDARMLAGKSQTKLAKEIGIAKETFCAWENGRRALTTAQVKDLAAILNTSTDFLLGINDISYLEYKPLNDYIKLLDNKPVYTKKYGWVLINVKKNIAITSENQNIPLTDIEYFSFASHDYKTLFINSNKILSIDEIKQYSKVWVKALISEKNGCTDLDDWYDVYTRSVKRRNKTSFLFSEYNITWIAYNMDISAIEKKEPSV